MSALGYQALWDSAVPGLVHLTTPILPTVWESALPREPAGTGARAGDSLSVATVGRLLLGDDVPAKAAADTRRSFFNQITAQVLYKVA